LGCSCIFLAKNIAFPSKHMANYALGSPKCKFSL